MSTVPISAIILDNSELAPKILDLDNANIPPVPGDVTQKYRWLQLVVKNETQFYLDLGPEYFDSGRYDTLPSLTDPCALLNCTGCNRDGSVGTGVSGGQSFKLQLGDPRHIFEFAIGFTNPAVGQVKAGVVEGTAKDGYNNTTERGNTITSSKIYTGKDKNNNPVNIKFRVSAVPSQPTVLFVVRQIRA